MPIIEPDHFTVLTQDATATAEFYEYTLGLRPGPRPNFAVPGIWLYSGVDPILHLVEKDEIPNGPGVLDHIAFRGTDLEGAIGKLKARSIAYDVRRVPAGGPWEGVWQLFFRDPNGARVEINFATTEVLPLEA
jgi:catechol 2,3-dioxygenase-like lactoylglutathione lyase family enzyme